jgi:hypothetical protein
MQVIVAPGSTRLLDRIAIVRAVVVGVLLLVASGALLWLCVATPIVTGFIPHGRPSALESAGVIVVWGFAIVIPAVFGLLGVARLAAVAETLAATRPRRVTPALAKALGPDHLAATNLRLPDGRRVHELVIGPFGIVVLGHVPSRQATRHVGTRWEIRDDRGRWLPIEDPVQRASRDAERVRSWLAADDRDFLVRVHAAIVTADPNIERSASCAVVAPEALAGWLESLPLQRGFTPHRQERIVEMVRTLAGVSAR